jgi:hypothetical protein
MFKGGGEGFRPFCGLEVGSVVGSGFQNKKIKGPDFHLTP